MEQEVANNFWWYFIPMMIYTVPLTILVGNIIGDIILIIIRHGKK